MDIYGEIIQTIPQAIFDYQRVCPIIIQWNPISISSYPHESLLVKHEISIDPVCHISTTCRSPDSSHKWKASQSDVLTPRLRPTAMARAKLPHCCGGFQVPRWSSNGIHVMWPKSSKEFLQVVPWKKTSLWVTWEHSQGQAIWVFGCIWFVIHPMMKILRFVIHPMMKIYGHPNIMAFLSKIPMKIWLGWFPSPKPGDLPKFWPWESHGNRATHRLPLRHQVHPAAFAEPGRSFGAPLGQQLGHRQKKWNKNVWIMRLGLKMLGKSSQFWWWKITIFTMKLPFFFGGSNVLPMSFATILQDVQCEPAPGPRSNQYGKD